MIRGFRECEKTERKKIVLCLKFGLRMIYTFEIQLAFGRVLCTEPAERVIVETKEKN